MKLSLLSSSTGSPKSSSDPGTLGWEIWSHREIGCVTLASLALLSDGHPESFLMDGTRIWHVQRVKVTCSRANLPRSSPREESGLYSFINTPFPKLMVTLVSQELSQQPSVYFGRDLSSNSTLLVVVFVDTVWICIPGVFSLQTHFLILASPWCTYLHNGMCIWRFPEIGIALNHPFFIDGISLINHAFLGIPLYGKPYIFVLMMSFQPPGWDKVKVLSVQSDEEASVPFVWKDSSWSFMIKR